MKKVLFFCTFFVAALSLATKAPFEKVAEKTLFNGEKLYEFRLPNELRVLTIPRHQAKVLTYQTWFDVGSIDEKLDPKLKKTGLAHLFEHMMFRGSEKYPFPGFEQMISRLGADRQNASTHYYRTNYYESVPSRQLEKLMELESDRTRALKLEKKMLEDEKGAVVGELRLYHLDKPAAMARDAMMQQIFSVSPYRWTIIGTESEIRGFTLEEAQYFYRTYYAPNNASLVVVGDIEPEPLMKLVTKYYGDIPAQKIPKISVSEEQPQKKERRVDKTHPQATSELLMVAYRSCDINSPDFVSLNLLGAHLSSGMEALMRKKFVDTGIAVAAMGQPSAKPDLFEFYILLAENHTANEALKTLDQVVASLQKKPIAKTELERARNQELLDLYTQINDGSGMANLLGEYLMLSGNYLKGLEIVEAYKNISARDLQQAAKKYFKRESRSIVAMRPEKKK